VLDLLFEVFGKDRKIWKGNLFFGKKGGGVLPGEYTVVARGEEEEDAAEMESALRRL
jgi:hypothetical protein